MSGFRLTNIKMRRITSSFFYLEQLDGLRFLPIMIVVFYHLTLFISDYTKYIFIDDSSGYYLLNLMKINGHRGVELFFVISGLILSLPFARQYIKNGQKVSVIKYFFRRLTRIEPPYIIMLAVNLITIYLFFGVSFNDLVKSFFLSALYIHNFFPDYYWINYVTWSLEIEIQFYLLAPILCLFYLFRSKYRRIGIILVILLMSWLLEIIKLPFVTVINYLPHFLLGMLLADIYISKNSKINFKSLNFPIGIVLILIISFYINNYILYKYILFSCIALFYLMVITNDLWKKIFSAKWLVIIGTMCYSIYLIHPIAIAVIGFNTLSLKVSDYFIVYFIFQFIIILTSIMLASALFYIVIERPCMDQNWPKKLITFIKNRITSKKTVEEM